MEELMLDLMYYLPSYKRVKEFVVTYQFFPLEKFPTNANDNTKAARDEG